MVAARCTTATPRRPIDAGGGEDSEPLTRKATNGRPSFAATDALFAENVERKMSTLLAHFGRARRFQIVLNLAALPPIGTSS